MDHLEAAPQAIRDIAEPSAATVDQTGAFPRAAGGALGRAGLFGSGGLGEGHRAATLVVAALARASGSTATEETAKAK